MTMAMFDDPRDFKHLGDYKMIDSPEDVGEVLRAVESTNMFALDTETTSLDWVVADLVGLSISVREGKKDWYLTRGAERTIMPELNRLVDTDKRMVAMHNARYDIHILRKYGFKPKKVFDTYIAQSLIDENQRLALKSLAYKLGIDDDLPTYKDLQRETAKAMGMKIKDVTIHMIPLNRLAPYAARDTRLTLDLVPVSIKELKDEEMWDIFVDNEMPMMHVLLEMEERGWALDQKLLEEMIVKYHNLVEDNYNKVVSLGIQNPNSNQQIADYLYGHLGLTPRKYTDSGDPSTDILALQRLMQYTPEGELDLDDPATKDIDSILTYRKATKLLGTYLEPFRDQQHNGRIHTSYNATSGRDAYGTVTSRLTSSNPNLQNVPGMGMGAEIRYLFIASEGMGMVVIDYSQLELRILAHYSRDPNLLRAFVEGLDPHQMTADRIGIKRKFAKNVNFGWAYGVGGRTLADIIEKAGNPRPNERQASEWLKGFGKAYPTAEKWKWDVIRWARKLGYVKTIDGHKRRLPDLHSKVKGDRARAERQAPNAVIQGSAAGIMRYVMLRDETLNAKYGSYMLGQVHDELAWECPLEVIEEMANESQALMESVEDVFQFRVPIIAEPGIGNSWAEAK